MTTKALATLIEHASEQYPHFESPRGQADIRAAKEENAEILDALQTLHNYMNSAYVRKAFEQAGAQAAYHTIQHKARLALMKGQ